MKVTPEITNNVSKFAPKAAKMAPDRITKAVLKGGGIVKREAQARAPYKNIANAVKVVQGSGKGQFVQKLPEALVGIKRGKRGEKVAWYGKFFESGTKKHKIAPKNAEQLAWPVSAGRFNVKTKSGRVRVKKFYQQGVAGLTTKISAADWVYLKKGMSVRHPGMQAKPFLVPAYEATKDQVKTIIADAVLKVMSDAKGGLS